MWRTTLLVTLAVISSAVHVAAGILQMLSFLRGLFIRMQVLHIDSHSAHTSAAGSDRAAVLLFCYY